MIMFIFVSSLPCLMDSLIQRQKTLDIFSLWIVSHLVNVVYQTKLFPLKWGVKVRNGNFNSIYIFNFEASLREGYLDREVSLQEHDAQDEEHHVHCWSVQWAPVSGSYIHFYCFTSERCWVFTRVIIIIVIIIVIITVTLYIIIYKLLYVIYIFQIGKSNQK